VYFAAAALEQRTRLQCFFFKITAGERVVPDSIRAADVASVKTDEREVQRVTGDFFSQRGNKLIYTARRVLSILFENETVILIKYHAVMNKAVFRVSTS
jgi:hypothetical protein